MKKLAVKFLLVAAIVFAVNGVVELFLPVGWANLIVRKKLDAWSEREERIDLLFLGTSRFYRHIDPARFDERMDDSFPTRSFNCAGAGFFNPERYALLERIIDDPPPALAAIICELDAFDRRKSENRHTPRNLYWRTPELTVLGLREIWSEPDTSGRVRASWIELQLLVERALHAGMGRKVLVGRLAPAPDTVLGPAGDGYYSLDREAEDRVSSGLQGLERRRKKFLEDPSVLDARRREVQAAFENRDRLPPPNAVHVELINDLIERAKARGIHLIFCMAPRVPTAEPILALHDALPALHRMEVADPRLYPELYERATSFDRGHMTDAGAARCTARLADRYRELREKYLDAR